jgi:hypothetical protein
MAVIRKIGKFLLGGGLLGAGVKALVGGKSKKAAVAVPQATRDDAAAAIAADDELRRRKGGAADILTGSRGAEAALTGGKLVLGS